MDAAVTFFFCVEPNSEIAITNATALAKSIRLFGGTFSSCPIIAVTPRDEPVSSSTLMALEQCGVTYAKAPFASKKQFPHANKISAGVFIEIIASTTYLVFLDTDSLILNEPTLFFLSEDEDIGLTPVWAKGIGCSGPSDASMQLWRAAFTEFEKNIPDERVVTILEGEQIIPYYNSGMILTKKKDKFYSHWHSVFDHLISKVSIINILNPPCLSHYKYNPLMFIEQFSLAVAVGAYLKRVKILPATYNCPLHHKETLSAAYQNTFFDLDHVVQWHHNNYLHSPDVLKTIGIDQSTTKLKYLEFITSQGMKHGKQPTADDNAMFLCDFNKIMLTWRRTLNVWE